jgi:fucose permease
MPDAFGFGRRELAASLNLGHVFFALGALITPTLADLLVRTLDFKKTAAALALICLLPALVAAISFSEPTHGFDLKGQEADLGQVLADPHIWLTGLAFLLYAPLEFAVSTWGTTYLTSDLGYRERRAAWALSFFWLAFLASRVLMTLLIRWLGEEWAPRLLFVLALAAAAAMGNLAGAAKKPHAAWGLLLLGLALGPIFPTLIAIAIGPFPLKRGTAYGAMFAVGSLGSLFLAPLIGAFARGKTVVRAFRLLAPLALLLALATLALWMKA